MLAWAVVLMLLALVNCGWNVGTAATDWLDREPMWRFGLILGGLNLAVAVWFALSVLVLVGWL